jgi:S-DNA-T family DNA segregation ATPase FtsK/SpoIIIE
VTDALGRVTRGFGADIAGLVAVGFGLLAGLGLYAHRAGVVGRGLDRGLGDLVGVAKLTVPVLAVVIGVVLIVGGRGERASLGRELDLEVADDGVPSPAEVAPHRRVQRMVGSVLLLLCGLGLLHLARGGPRLSAPLRELAHAGGLIGATLVEPLRAALAVGGAVVVFVLVAVIGALLLTGVTLRRAAGTAADGVRPAGSAMRRAFGSLFRLDPQAASASEAGPVVEIYDQDVDAGAEQEYGAPAFVGPAHAAEAERNREPEPEPEETDGRSGSGTSKGRSGEQLEIDLGPGARRSAWKLPPLKLLGRAGSQSVDRAAIEETGRTLEHALAEHGVETRLVGMTVGPTVTRYELELGPGVKVARVTSLQKDIAYAMATPDVRLLAPIPGRQAIGVEVPNNRKQLVTVGDILGSEEAKKATRPLEVAVGRDIAGKPVLVDLATMPHVLIAGATGSGKSSCINSIMTSLLMRTTPDQVRLILVDPKRVELGQYNGLPHLLTEVVTNPKKAANALAWAVREMERRYDLLSEVGVRDVSGYNAAFDRGELKAELGTDREYQRLPFIVVVVDELNDLMMVAARDVEESITRIAQMARAVGLHLVIATQRPSVNVITGVIKANIPARWAFAVSSLADSRVILDQPGAEKLLGKGDMLLLGPASSVPRRIQGSWVTEDEVRKAVAHWKRQAPEVAYEDGVQGSDDGPAGSGSGIGGSSDDDDDLVNAALELVVRSQLGSTSMLQRKLRVGFARAGRIMDLLEQRGVVGPSEGSKARAVLMTPEELDGLGATSGTT